MSLTNSPIWMSATAAGFYDYEISNSIRIGGSDGRTGRLKRTPASTGNRQTFTMSCWLKRNGRLLNDVGIFYASDGSNEGNSTNAISFKEGKLEFISFDQTARLLTNQLFRDTSAWYHIVVVSDTTNATADDRMRIYVNGEQVTSFETRNNPSQNLNWGMFNNTVEHGFGALGKIYTPSSDYYLSECYFIDGQALGPTNFGETKSGIWVPKEYGGSFGTNGFYLEFGNSAALGTDTSGNSNNFTVENLSSHDQMIDTPTRSFATLNLLDAGSNVTLSDGNLVFASSAADGGCRSTINFAGDKYYVEAIVGTYGNAFSFGIANKNRSLSADAGEDLNDFYGWYINPSQNWIADGSNPWNTGSNSNSGSLDVMQMFVDASDPDSIKVFAGINNTYYDSSGGTTANPSTGANPTATITGGEEWAIGLWNRNSASSNIVVNFGQDSSFAGNKTAAGNTDANGIGDFFYSVPTNGKALCTTNLPDPGVDPAANEEPTDYFNTVLYTGNGSASHAITGVGFSPDFCWLKKRSGGAANHRLLDVIRGVQKNIYSDAGTAEETQNSIMSFDSDGFTLGDSNGTNQSGHTFVGWNWKAGGSGSSNTDGSITSTVSANQTSGFSIVTYSGNGTAGATIGHGLGKVPNMLIVKRRNETRNWQVYHSGNTSAPETEKLTLNLSDATVDDNTSWNDTAPSSSVFTVGTSNGTNNSSGTYVAYCFADIDGFSKFGSYTGNGSSDGTFIYTGFKPAFIMIKATESTGGASNWRMLDSVRDTFNAASKQVQANTNDTEESGSGAGFVDILSNGFKLRNTALQLNASGKNFIYMTFAEQPFKYANAR